ncbi:MAG: glycoside hydrolase family 3 protein, partial [Streptosporangiales bacterium]
MTTSTEATAERSRVAALPVEEKVRLLTGADSWRTYGATALGLRPIVMSDGPAGVRGITKDDRNPSASIPCPSALGATWDGEHNRERPPAKAAQARDKGVDVVLAPTINLMRTPLGGRGFECFSEDPVLSARLAVGYVRGLRAGGVGAAVKHYVGNDSETERWTYDVRIAEAVLRELYLVPFEACVREAGTAMVMAAYNAVNGARMTEHPWLLRDVLKGEWGFAGAVVSDWDAARSTVPTAQAGLDLVMPGPDGPWGEALIQAVRDGTVAEELIDDKVLRLLEVARQVGALAPAAGPGTPDGRVDGPADGRVDGPVDGAPVPGLAAAADGAVPRTADHGLLRRVAAASFTLLRNERTTLPIDPATAGSIALIGPNATHPVIQGGGSAAVHPAFISTPSDALRQALDGQATLTVSPGCHTWEAVPEPPAATVTDPVTGEPGVRLEFRAADGTLLGSEHRAGTVFAWWGDGLPAGIGWGEPGTISVLASYTPQQSGPHLVGAAGVGRLRVTVDGAIAAQGDTPVPADPVETMTRPGEITGQVEFTAGEAAEVRLDFLPSAEAEGPLAVRLGIVAAPDEDAALAQAVA